MDTTTDPRSQPGPAQTMTHVDLETGEIITPTGTDLTPATVDGEWVSRESRLQTLELQALHARNNYVRSTLELGQILIEHRDLCREQGERVTALLDRLGFTPSHAYQVMRVASTVAQLPSLRDLAERQYSHVLTLIQGADDDLLRQISSGEQKELPIDDIAKMSVRELRSKLRKFTEDFDTEVAKETKAICKERDAVIKDRDRLAALVGDDLDAARRVTKTLREQSIAFQQTLSGFYRQLENQTLLETQTPRGQLLLDQIEREIQGMAEAMTKAWSVWCDTRETLWGHSDDATPVQD